jgi:hypothetical protein
MAASLPILGRSILFDLLYAFLFPVGSTLPVVYGLFMYSYLSFYSEDKRDSLGNRE